VNVHLTPELEQLVQTKVRSGGYNSASEVVREAIQIQELRGPMDRALAESARGEGSDGEEILQGLMEDLEAGSRRKAGWAGTSSCLRPK
jgi:antitoxin ParD1/3/4